MLGSSPNLACKVYEKKWLLYKFWNDCLHIGKNQVSWAAGEQTGTLSAVWVRIKQKDSAGRIFFEGFEHSSPNGTAAARLVCHNSATISIAYHPQGDRDFWSGRSTRMVLTSSCLLLQCPSTKLKLRSPCWYQKNTLRMDTVMHEHLWDKTSLTKGIRQRDIAE